MLIIHFKCYEDVDSMKIDQHKTVKQSTFNPPKPMHIEKGFAEITVVNHFIYVITKLQIPRFFFMLTATPKKRLDLIKCVL